MTWNPDRAIKFALMELFTRCECSCSSFYRSYRRITSYDAPWRIELQQYSHSAKLRQRRIRHGSSVPSGWLPEYRGDLLVQRYVCGGIFTKICSVVLHDVYRQADRQTERQRRLKHYLFGGGNKKLRYREKHSASVVLSWCTMTFLGRKSLDG